MNVFLDTNIFLGFYHFSSDDLRELEKLDAVLMRGDITVDLPKHVEIEFERNRENRISDALARLRKVGARQEYPQFCKGYAQYGDLRRTQREFDETLLTLLTNVEADIADHNLAADRTVRAIMERARTLPCNEVILQQARNRVALGNPPGKNNSLGDAVIWECLLSHGTGGDIYFITDDQDYSSAIDRNQFKDVLLREWAETQGGHVHYFKTLSGFLRAHFPDIDIESEREKASLIHALLTSSSFVDTHQIVARLRQFAEFSDQQAISIIDAAFLNEQVRWICTDADVAAFVESVIEGREPIFDQRKLIMIRVVNQPNDVGDDDEFIDVPF